jgi:DNA-damage-inducible protein J
MIMRLKEKIVRETIASVKTRIAREKVPPFEMRIPNELTAQTLAKSERGEDVYHARDADDLFDQLGI